MSTSAETSEEAKIIVGAEVRRRQAIRPAVRERIFT
jgi:hypothetical protein